MDNINIKSDENGNTTFYILHDTKQIGELAAEINGKSMTAYHTEVLEEYEGKGFAKKLVTAMADYARQNDLKVTPLCPYVNLQFNRNPEEYNDIWNKEKQREV